MEKNHRLEAERRELLEAENSGWGQRLLTYTRLSGPGWLQSAITLGGGSLSGALFLGIIGGYHFLWLQIAAIVMGVVMLSAISYITLTIKERPFQAINLHISPVLGWGWALATLAANMVWSLPQFSLSTAAIQQNLLPGALQGTFGKAVISVSLLLIAAFVIWFYDRPGPGKKIFESILKTLVALIVLSFVGVVLKLAFTGQGLPLGEIFKGYLPNLASWSRPADSFLPFLSQVEPAARAFWSQMIVGMQRDVIIAAAAAAVGINMTFLLPYSMLARGWDKSFRGLAVFDLGLGMVIPFVLVTSCVVIASASQFHAKPGDGLVAGSPDAHPKLLGQYQGMLEQRMAFQKTVPGAPALGSPEELSLADKQLAAMLVKRDAFHLANSLKPLLGSTFANLVFGLGVLGMGLSTIIVLMLISGFVVCEIFGLPQQGAAHRWSCMLAGVGVLGPFIWSGKTLFWLAIPTSVFGMMLLPVAYLTFFFMMNSRRLMGVDRPRGGIRVLWNVLMGVSCFGVLIAASWTIWNKTQWVGTSLLVLFAVAVLVTWRRAPSNE